MLWYRQLEPKIVKVLESDKTQALASLDKIEELTGQKMGPVRDLFAGEPQLKTKLVGVEGAMSMLAALSGIEVPSRRDPEKLKQFIQERAKAWFGDLPDYELEIKSGDKPMPSNVVNTREKRITITLGSETLPVMDLHDALHEFHEALLVEKYSHLWLGKLGQVVGKPETAVKIAQELWDLYQKDPETATAAYSYLHEPISHGELLAPLQERKLPGKLGWFFKFRGKVYADQAAPWEAMREFESERFATENMHHAATDPKEREILRHFGRFTQAGYLWGSAQSTGKLASVRLGRYFHELALKQAGEPPRGAALGDILARICALKDVRELHKEFPAA